MAVIEPGSEPAAPEAPAAVEVPDFANVREAQAWQREHGGDPGVVQTPDEPILPVAPVEPVADDYSDLFTKPPVEGPAGVPPAATPAAPAATPPEPSTDPYAQWGGQQAVEDAIVVSNALKTESGVRAVVAQGLTALGYDPSAVQAFLASPAGQAAVAAGGAPAAPEAPADPWADISDEDVLDGATVKQMLGRVVSEISDQIKASQLQAQQPVLEQIQVDRQRNAQRAVDTTLAELLTIDPTTGPTDVQKGQILDIQQFAQRYVEADNWDPVHIANAVRRGAADLAARDEARFQAYVADKRRVAAAAPANIGSGGPAGGEPIPEPKNAKEAADIRKRLNLF